MEDWVHRALERWPNVPALYGWLKLDRRGRWLIKGEVISRSQIIDTINPNYAADERGCWYFQNGPQRGYMALEYTPLVLRVEHDRLKTHTGLAADAVSAAYLDEEGALVLVTEHGPGVLAESDLDWALRHLERNGQPVNDDDLAAALALPSGMQTALRLRLGYDSLPVQRLDAAQMPGKLGLVR